MWPMQTDLGNLELVSCCRPHFAGESKLISQNTHRLSRVQLFVTLWAAAHQAPLSTRFSRQEYWSGFPFLTPGNLLDPRISTHVSCIGRWVLLQLNHLGSPIIKHTCPINEKSLEACPSEKA